MTHTTDRELLELAAKAAGYQAERIERRVARIDKFKMIKHERRDGFMLARKAWNPLEDDGDALRLAVKLGLLVDISLAFIVKETIVTDGTVCVVERHGMNPSCAATRRAIVRAAAEIGRAAGGAA